MTPLEIVLAASGGLALLFVVGELGARAWLQRRGRYYVWPPGWRARLELDGEALPFLPPVAEWSINAEGERGDPLPSDWRDTSRVLAAGGSTTECYFIDQEDTWPKILQELLRAPASLSRLGARDVYVGNVGRSVMDCEYLDAIFRRLLPRYERLDVIVLFINASDAVKWMHLRQPEEWPELPLPTNKIFGEHPEGPFGWAPRTLALRRVVSGLARRLRSSVEVRTGVGKRLVDLRRMRAGRTRTIEELPDLTPLMEHFDACLRRLLETAREHAPRVLYVAQPWFEKDFTPEELERMWNFGLGRPYHERLDTYYSHEVVARMLRAVADRGLAIARELGCEALDMQAEVPCTLENYYDYLHHTPSGNRRLAEAMARALVGEAAADRDDPDVPGPGQRAPAGRRSPMAT